MNFSTITVFLVNFGLFVFFIYWFLKFRPSFLYAVLFLSVLPVWSIFRHTDFGGGLIQNSAFLAGFYNSLLEGNFVPRWAERLDTYFGYPAYIFIYPLPLYIGSFFKFIGFSFVDSIKLVFFVTYVISGYWMWKWSKLKFTRWAALAATIAFLFAPYRLINIHYRFDLGESVAISIIPLLFYCMDRKNNVGISLYSFLLILSHPAISVSTLVLSFFYLVTGRKIREIVYLVLGVLLASYYWLPIFMEGHYANIDAYTKVIEFFPYLNYFWSPFKFGLLFQGGAGVTVFPIGYTLLLVVIISSLKYKKFPRAINFWLFSFAIILLFLSPLSKFFWEITPILNRFQFSYRLLGVNTIITAIISGYLFSYIVVRQRLIIFLFIVLTSGVTILNWRNREFTPSKMTDSELNELLPVQSRIWKTGFPQALPRWTNLNELWGPENYRGDIEILSGLGKIFEQERSSVLHRYIVEAKSNIYLRENTFYYPGWKLYVNNIEKDFSYEHSSVSGTIEFSLPSGKHEIVLRFVDTFVRKIGLVISTVTGLLLLVLNSGFLRKNNNIVWSKNDRK